MAAEMLEKAGDILLHGGEQRGKAAFKVLREGTQVAGVGLAGEGPQAFLDAHVVAIVLEQIEIPWDGHRLDYRRACDGVRGGGRCAEPRSSRNQVR